MKTILSGSKINMVGLNREIRFGRICLIPFFYIYIVEEENY